MCLDILCYIYWGRLSNFEVKHKMISNMIRQYIFLLNKDVILKKCYTWRSLEKNQYTRVLLYYRGLQKHFYEHKT